MRALLSARALPQLPVRLLVEALEIGAAMALGRYCGTRLADALRAYPAHRASVGGTLKIVRVIVAYLAILTIVWALEFSSLAFVHQIAVVVVAAFAGGGVLDGRTPVIRAVCGRCGKTMTPLAETSTAVAFGCRACGTSLSVPR